MSMDRTTLLIPAKIRVLALKYGINMSLVARIALLEEIKDYEYGKQRRKKVKNYTATLAPLQVDDIVFENDCSEVDVE